MSTLSDDIAKIKTKISANGYSAPHELVHERLNITPL